MKKYVFMFAFIAALSLNLPCSAYAVTDAPSANVLAQTAGDITGTGERNLIYLTGDKQQDSPLILNITLHVQGFEPITVKNNEAYNVALFAGDFTGDKIDDVLVSIYADGSGGLTNGYIYTFTGRETKIIFDSDAYNGQYKYTVKYLDQYKVEVLSMNNRQRYLIDVSERDKEYLGGIYDNKGKLKSPKEGWVDPVSSLFPVDPEMNGIYQLLMFQRISGLYHADGLGYVQNFLKYDNGKFNIDDQFIGINPAGMD